MQDKLLAVVTQACVRIYVLFYCIQNLELQNLELSVLNVSKKRKPWPICVPQGKVWLDPLHYLVLVVFI